MPSSHSFQEYVSNRFDNEFWAAAEKYLDENFASRNLSLSRLHKIGEPQIEDVKVEHVWTSDLPGMEIRFDVALDIDIVVPDADHHYDNEEEKHFWLMVSCHGDLAQDLNDFRIDDISEYRGRGWIKDPMDDALVPVISSDDLEYVAEQFLCEHYPKALERPIWVNPVSVAEAMGLNVKLVHLSWDGSVFGKCFFFDADVELYDPDEDQTYTEHVKAGTILVDQTATFMQSFGTWTNTVIHECVHWDKHKKAFALARLYNTELTNIGCKVIGGIVGDRSDRSAVGWMEWQANALTPRIQMPLKMFRQQAMEYVRVLRKENGNCDIVDIIEPAIDLLMEHFGVSRLAAKIRMADIGYMAALGAFNHVDGHYVRPYSFQRDAIKVNQTFTIGAQDAARLMVIDPEFRELLRSGDYLFVENHFVYNTPEYIECNEEGEHLLTRYARTHMDECCLVFDMHTEVKVGRDYQMVCFLNREPGNYVFELKYNNGYQNALPEKQVAMRRQEMEEAKKIRDELPDDPEKCVKRLLDWRGMTYSDIGRLTGKPAETFRRAAQGKTDPTIETAVLICFSLHLPPILSEKLLEVFNLSFNYRKERDIWLQEALYTMYACTNFAINKHLKQYGIEIYKKNYKVEGT